MASGNHHQKLNLVGRRFDRLTVTAFLGVKKRYRYWLCTCDCGNTTERPTYELLRRENRGEKMCWTCLLNKIHLSTHGASRTRLYRSWINMHVRCKDWRCFKSYGAKGVKIGRASCRERV